MKKIIFILMAVFFLASCTTYRIQARRVWYTETGVALDTTVFSVDVKRHVKKDGVYPIPRKKIKLFAKHTGTKMTGKKLEGGLYKYEYFIDLQRRHTYDR